MKLISLSLAALLIGSALHAADAPKVNRLPVNTLRVASAVADAETVTIGSVVFEVDTAADPGAITAGRTRLNLSAAQTAAAFTTALEAAINATNVLGFRVKASRISAGEVLCVNYQGSALAVAETLAGTNNAWASATFYGGADSLESKRASLIQARAANATEAALETMHFVFPFSPGAVAVQVRSAAGVLKAFDGAVNAAAAIVTVASAGSVDVAATDIVTIIASD